MTNIVSYFQLLYKSQLSIEDTNKFLYFSFFKVLLPFIASIVPMDFVFLILVSKKKVTLLAMCIFFLIMLFLPKVASILEYILHSLFLTFVCMYHPNSTIAIAGIIASIVLMFFKTVVAGYKVYSFWPAYENPFVILWLK